MPFSAVLSGVREVEVRKEPASGERGQAATLLFVDEIRRFGKAQQDAFLPFVERGDVTLVGATTENPSFELNAALLSRCRVLVLEPLEIEDVVELIGNALAGERGFDGRLRLDEDQILRVANAADGDARRALTLLETVGAMSLTGGVVDEDVLTEALQRKATRYDKSGEQHYDLISALHKSVRNSDENASLYWLARMRGGGGPAVPGAADRRDRLRGRGLAEPYALRIALDAAEALIGWAEGDNALAEPWSTLRARGRQRGLRRAGRGDRRALHGAEPVPLHLRNAPKEAGWGLSVRPRRPGAVEDRCLPGLVGRRYGTGRTTERRSGLKLTGEWLDRRSAPLQTASRRRAGAEEARCCSFRDARIGPAAFPRCGPGYAHRAAVPPGRSSSAG